MNVRSVILCSLVPVCMAGCLLRSVHPLVTEQSAMFAPELLGTWIDTKTLDSWSFHRWGETSYRLHFYQRVSKRGTPTESPGDTAVFHVHLGMVGGGQFLDLQPVEGPEGYTALRNEFYNLHLFPTHSFLRLRFDSGLLRLAQVDPEWLQAQIDSGAVSVKHERTGDALLLTASTQDLQLLFARLATQSEAYPVEAVLQRSGP